MCSVVLLFQLLLSTELLGIFPHGCILARLTKNLEVSWNLKPSSLTRGLCVLSHQAQSTEFLRGKVKLILLPRRMPQGTHSKCQILLTLSSNQQKHMCVKTLAFHEHLGITDLTPLCVNSITPHSNLRRWAVFYTHFADLRN